MSKKEIIIIIILICIAIVRFFFFTSQSPSYNNFIGQEVKFTGIVNDDPDVRLNNQHLNVKLKGQDTTILVITYRSFEVSYGDEINVVGVLEEPENFTTNSGKEFNYKRYLANQNIYFMMKNPTAAII